jgi:hypothetical protein
MKIVQLSICLVIQFMFASIAFSEDSSVQANGQPDSLSLALSLPALTASDQAKPDELKGTPIDLQQEKAKGGDVVWLGLGASVNLLQIDLSTKKYVLGISPGLGFGLRWSPAWWSLTDTFLSLDLFFNANFVNVDTTEEFDYFQLDVTPVVTIIDLIAVGFGARILISVNSAYSNSVEAIFSFGYGTSLGNARQNEDAIVLSAKASGTDKNNASNKKDDVIKSDNIFKRNFISLATSCGLILPLGTYADQMDMGYVPLVSLGYNFVINPVIVSFGILSGMTAEGTKSEAPFPYDSYGIPIAFSLGFSFMTNSPFVLFADVDAGMSVNMRNYREANSYSESALPPSLYLAPSVGAGYYFTPNFDIDLSCKVFFIPTQDQLEFAIAPDLCLELNF